MRSSTAKVLHKLGGRPLIAHVCRTASALVKGERPVYVVVGHQAEEVKEAVRAELGEGGAVFVTQTEQRGTGDAVFAARDVLGDANSTLLVLSGDVPLVRAETLGSLVVGYRTEHSFTSEEETRLEGLAELAAMALDHARLFGLVLEHPFLGARGARLHRALRGLVDACQHVVDPMKPWRAGRGSRI